MNDRPRIVLEALQVQPDPAGTGRGILDLCAALAEKERDLDFSVLTTAPELFAELENRPGWEVVDCPGAGGGNLRKALYTQLGLPGLLRRLKADLLHCMQFIVPLRCPCPLVATVHDLTWVRFPETIGELRRSYYGWMVPRSLAKVDAVVANSRATAADTAGHFPAIAGKIHVTEHGTPRWVLERMGDAGPVVSPRPRPFFLFVGTREPRKNLSRLLDAYTLFLESEQVGQAPPGEVPDLVFAGGKGWKDADWRRRMETLRDGGRLHVLDYCDPDHLWDLYRSAVALVFPSLHEGFGLPVLEAMAAGLPVLTSAQGGTAEVAGGDALLVDPENTAQIAQAMARIAFDGELRASLREAGPVRARGWSWSRTADLTVAVYLDVLERARAKKALPRVS